MYTFPEVIDAYHIRLFSFLISLDFRGPKIVNTRLLCEFLEFRDNAGFDFGLRTKKRSLFAIIAEVCQLISQKIGFLEFS